MRSAILGAAYLALVGCATTCPQGVTPSAPPALYNRLYALRGTVISDLAKGHLTGHQALALSAQLNTVQGYLEAGSSAAASAAMDAVQASVKLEAKP